VLHLYGVTRASADPARAEGRGGRSVSHVTGRGLAVVVSEIEETSTAGPKDLLAHARVLEDYVERETVLPMQFGIALPDEDAVRLQVLERDGKDLDYLMEAFEGVVQLTVQAFHHEEPALKEVLRRAPALVAERDRLRSGTTAQAHRVQVGQAVAELLEYLQEEDGQVVLDHLAPLALAVSDGERNGTHQLLNAAFLVDRAARPAFDKAVAEVATLLEERVRLRYVGPQPPYSFLEPVRNGELAWG
jgi:PAS domain-containing protein